MIDEHHQLQTGMSIELVIASKSKDFSDIVTVSDAYIPACDLWIGDYPYLDKARFRRLCKQVLRESIRSPARDSEFIYRDKNGNLNTKDREDEVEELIPNEIIPSSRQRNANLRRKREYKEADDDVIEIALPLDGSSSSSASRYRD